MLKTYVGCALNQAPKGFVERVTAFKAHLSGAGYSVMEFVTDQSVSSEDVYRNDILEAVANCDFMIAMADHPSTGLGYEIASALYRFRKPVLLVSEHPEQLSRLIRGISAEFGPAMFQIRDWVNDGWLIERIIPDFLRSVGVIRSPE